MDIEAIADAIGHKFDTDLDYAKSVSKSMDLIRDAIYESGLVPDASEIEGTDEWHELVGELEVIFF